MRSIMVEEVVKVERYRAIDGTIFTDKKACEEYDRELHEKNTKYLEEHGRMCKVTPEISYATYEDYFFVIKVDSAETAIVLKQVVDMRGFTDEKYNEEQYKLINDAFETKSDVLATRFDDGDRYYSFYVYGTQAEITARTLDNYNKIFATEKED